MNGIQEVSGSIPLISTRKSLETVGFKAFYFCINKIYLIIKVPALMRWSRHFYNIYLWWKPLALLPDVLSMGCCCCTYFSLPYVSSVTASNHWLKQFTPGTSRARWENQLSGAAPCQCFTPVGMLTTSPGCSSRASWPHSW